MIAVTFALPAESSEFLKRLGNKSHADRNGIRIIRGEIDSREVEILHTGVGEQVCRERLGEFLQNQQFEFLISTGFAGALTDELRVGDLLLAKNFSTFDPNEDCSLFSMLRVHVADLLTVPALIESREERNRIASEGGAAAADMETKFIARACATYEIPLLSLRIISDTPSDLFPAPPHILFDLAKQRTDLVKLGAFFLSHPNRVPQLVQFARRIAHAKKTLADGLVKVVREV